MPITTERIFPGSIAFFLLLSISSCTFSSKTQKQLFSRAEKEQYDAIVVPGVPFENSQWSKTMKGRIYWSKFLYDKGIAKNIIYSGSAVYTPYYEGIIMAQYAEALGIPKEHIYTEIKAEHSTENIYYSYKLAKKLGYNRIALASDPFQSKSLQKFIRRKCDPSIAIIPIVIDTLRMLEPGMKDPAIDYQQAFKEGFIPITKRESFFKRWRGTRGKNIDTTLYN